jgi:hypothetical protein
MSNTWWTHDKRRKGQLCLSCTSRPQLRASPDGKGKLCPVCGDRWDAEGNRVDPDAKAIGPVSQDETWEEIWEGLSM